MKDVTHGKQCNACEVYTQPSARADGINLLTLGILLKHAGPAPFFFFLVVKGTQRPRAPLQIGELLHVHLNYKRIA